MEGVLETSAASAENVAVAEAASSTDQALDDGLQPKPKRGGQVCPSCGSHDCRRSHRTWWERYRNTASMYRCRQCHYRFPGL